MPQSRGRFRKIYPSAGAQVLKIKPEVFEPGEEVVRGLELEVKRFLENLLGEVKIQ